jgi:hypothetical protein
VVNAASYVPLIAVLARWRPPPNPQTLPRETLGTAVAAGIRYVAMSPVIRTVLVRSAAFGLGASAIMALLPLVAKVLIGGGPVTYGLLLGAFRRRSDRRRSWGCALAPDAVDRGHRPLGRLRSCARRRRSSVSARNCW